MSMRSFPSTCWECGSTCGSLVTVSDGRVTKVGPNKAHPHSAGAFCAKGIRALPQWTYGERRLLHPLKRIGVRGSGQWQQIDWDEALELVAQGFADVIRRHGAPSVAGAVSGAFFSRGPVMALLMRALGSPNFMINQDLCGGCRAVSDRVTGLAIGGGEDIEHTNCALIVGRNPYAADPVQWRALEAARKRGAGLVVIDPNQSPAAERADLWLRPRPGTDAALALAMMQVIIAEQRYDHDFVQRWCHGFDALAARVAAYPPERAEALSGVPAADIVQAARRYAAGPSVFVSGHGIDAFSAGFQTFRAFHCLVAICGNVDREGGNRRAKRPPGLRTWLDLLHDAAFALPPQVEEMRIGAQRFPLWSAAGAWQRACHNPSVLDAILSGEPYPVRAMLVSGVNIVITYPDPRRTRAALEALDFLAVAAHEMNPTAALADVVLPKTTTLEEEEVQLQPGGPCVSYTQPAHPPLGEARSDLAIASALLDHLEPRVPVDRSRLPWRDKRAFNNFLLGDSGIDLDTLERDGFARFDYTLGNFEQQGFATPSGKVELCSQQLAQLGLDPLPDFTSPKGVTSEAWPLLLLTGEREKNFHHSRFRDQAWLEQQTPDPVLRVHPQTAARFLLEDGQWAYVHTAAGRCRLKVDLSERVSPGVVSTGMGWWRPRGEGPEFGALDVNVNAALSYAGPYDPVTGSPDSRGIPCSLSPAP